MSGENVFENIQNVLTRIEEIKRTFGMKRAELSGEFQDRLRETLQFDGRAGNPAVRGSGSNAPAARGAEEAAGGAARKARAEPAGRGGAPGAAGGASGDGAVGDVVREAAERYGLPEQLIRAVIRKESGYDRAAVSPKGAMGLMQLMPETADALGVSDPFDVEENVLGGTRYLRGLVDLYGGNLNKALAAYNAGPNRVGEEIPNIPETRDYVESVLEYYETFTKSQEGRDGK